MRRSFSMIEMLGVIIVIMILAGLLFPTISSIIEQGNKTKTKAKIVALQTAIMGYKSTYGYLPFTPTKTADDKLTAAEYDILLDCLTAEDSPPAKKDLNPRGIRFLEKKDAKYRDAWDNDFFVALDLNYDGEVDSGKVTGASSNVGSETAIWSMGSDENDSTTDDNIVSWKE
jgi:type II secretory pathway pseudopilin PulG